MPSLPPSLDAAGALLDVRAPVALCWHLVLLATVVWATLAPRRASRRLAGSLLCVPIASAAVLATLQRAYPDAVALGVLAASLLVAARKLSTAPFTFARGWPRWLGAAAIVLAVFYPPVVVVTDPLAYVAYAPIGVLPAATLLLVGGAALLLDRLDARTWSSALAAFTLGYGLLGVLLRDAAVDLALLPLSIALATRLRSERQCSPVSLAAERSRIDAFLRLERIALVGASHRENDFSRMVLRTLAERGIEVTPVNPGRRLIGGQLTYPRLGAIPHHVGGALIMTPPAQTLQVVEECAKLGIQKVWLHRGVGPGASSPEVLALCARLGLEVVADRCILMFVDPARASIHQAHACLERVLGRYPEDPAHA